MKKRQSNRWIPFWLDKWIFGSMRIEFNVEERGVWIDLIALAGKDDGFIRANEDFAYPLSQLAGMLIIPEGLLKKTIDKFIEKKKLTLHKNNVLYVTKWESYMLSRTAKHYAEVGRSEQSGSHSDKKSKAYNIIEENKIEDNIIEREDLSPTERQILKELKNVLNYPYDYLETIDYIRKLSIDFPRVDVLEEVKKKVAWWIDNPLKKKSNPHLQLLNWFKIATKFQAERQENDQIGGNLKPRKPERTQEEIDLIPKIEKLYKENLKKMSDKYGWKSEKDIDYMRVPFLDDYIEEKLKDFREGKRE